MNTSECLTDIENLIYPTPNSCLSAPASLLSRFSYQGTIIFLLPPQAEMVFFSLVVSKGLCFQNLPLAGSLVTQVSDYVTSLRDTLPVHPI